MATGYYLQDNPNPHAAQFGWPRSRVSGVIGVHTAENNTCFNGPDNGDLSVGEFVTGRRDFGSYHAAADVDSWRRWVHPRYSAWADTTNNAHAMSVSATVRANDWLALSEDRRRAVVVNLAEAAADLALVAVRDGLLDRVPPAQRISAAEAIAGTRMGFYGHGETNPGTRYDPGKDFNWTLFLNSYSTFVGGGIVPVGNITHQEEDDMPNFSERILDTIDGQKASLNEILNSIDRKQNQQGTVLSKLASALDQNLQLTSSILATRIPDPSDPKKSYTIADYIVWSATNAKLAAGSAGQALQNTSPESLARAVSEAQSSVTAKSVAAELQVNISAREGK